MFKVINKNNKCWSKEKAWGWYNNNQYIIGCNYIPQTAVNSTELWQRETFDINTIKKELNWASAIGYNSIRIFLQFIVWQDDRDGFIDRFAQVLKVAAENNIKVTPVLFDDCAFSDLEPYLGKQNEPVHLVHNSGWTPSPGTTYTNDFKTYSLLGEYVKDFISVFKEDERILMWDLYNEAGNSKRGAKSLYLVEKSFEWAREINHSQPLTVGLWAFENGSAVEGTKFVDLKAIELSDIITFHHYGNEEQVETSLTYYESFGYPLICTEWMARVHFESFFETVLPVFHKHNIGTYNWGLVNGKSQTHIPWDYDKSLGEPKIWFHDVLHNDGTPYSENEVNLIKKISEKSRSEKNE